MTAGTSAYAHGELMDQVYRWQRHIYDATRKYYLFGRDRMIRDLAVPPGGSVLEIGCGTGRNLSQVRRLWPDARLFGVDISAQMLETAHRRTGLSAVLALGDAASFDANRSLGERTFDRIMMPYCTSMIPSWQEAIIHACTLLGSGGSLHIVDFGDMASMPAALRFALRAWLTRFHVSPRDELTRFCARTAACRGLTFSVRQASAGYYQSITMSRPAAAGARG